MTGSSRQLSLGQGNHVGIRHNSSAELMSTLAVIPLFHTPVIWFRLPVWQTKSLVNNYISTWVFWCLSINFFHHEMLKNALLKCYPASLLHYETPQLKHHKLNCHLSCFSPTNRFFLSHTAMTDIDYFIFFFSRILKLGRKRYVLYSSEPRRLLPGKAPVVCQTYFCLPALKLSLWWGHRVLIAKGVSLSAPCTVLPFMLFIIRKARESNAQVTINSELSLFAEVFSLGQTLFWFIRENPMADRPKEYHRTRNLVWRQRGVDILSPGASCSLLHAHLFHS